MGVDSLSLEIMEGQDEPTSNLTMRIGAPLAEMERRLILATLEHFEGNKMKVADVLGVSVKTLYSRLREYKAE